MKKEINSINDLNPDQLVSMANDLSKDGNPNAALLVIKELIKMYPEKVIATNSNSINLNIGGES